jgi:hypothetical protein
VSGATPGTPAKPGGCALAACIVVLSLGALLWMAQLATLNDLTGSDAAGNGMSQGFAAIEIILVWILLAIAVVIAAIAGAVPPLAVFPALILLPISGIACGEALDLLAQSDTPPFQWPIVVSALVPPLVALFCLWALAPGVRRVVPAWYAAGIVWGVTLLVSVAVWPMQQVKQAVVDQQKHEAAKVAADYAALPAGAPLWDLTPFLATQSGVQQDEVLKRIRGLDRRRNDAELMLDRGDFPLRWLGQMDLTPTPALCDKARALLRKQLEPLVLRHGDVKPYAAVREPVANATQAMQWLIGYDCDARAEAKAWEAMANAYVNPGWDVHQLHELRDPNVLGRVLRESPERFDMLTPRSHLKAWLKFAEDPALRDRALAGARTLDHRTADAVEIFNGTEYEAWDMLIWLPHLDLDATPELCEAALREVRRELSLVYRPKPNDPRPYQELLDRMGTGEPLRALTWLSPRGCDTEPEVTEAEELVRSYQDSPDRQSMLATLSGLHRKR